MDFGSLLSGLGDVKREAKRKKKAPPPKRTPAQKLTELRRRGAILQQCDDTIPGSNSGSKSSAPSVSISPASSSPVFPAPARRVEVLALLFLVIDGLPFEDIWRAWIDGPDKGKLRPTNTTNTTTTADGAVDVEVRVWIHAKNPDDVRSEWVRRRLLPVSLRPTWGSVELTKAMVLLLETSLREEHRATRFVFLSESCLPLVPLQRAVRSALWEEHGAGGAGGAGGAAAEGRSWLRTTPAAANGHKSTQKQWGIAEAVVPKECRTKADQWTALTRRHAWCVVHLPEVARGVGCRDLWAAYVRGETRRDEERRDEQRREARTGLPPQPSPLICFVRCNTASSPSYPLPLSSSMPPPPGTTGHTHRTRCTSPRHFVWPGSSIQRPGGTESTCGTRR